MNAASDSNGMEAMDAKYDIEIKARDEAVDELFLRHRAETSAFIMQCPFISDEDKAEFMKSPEYVPPTGKPRPMKQDAIRLAIEGLSAAIELMRKNGHEYTMATCATALTALSSMGDVVVVPRDEWEKINADTAEQ